jgi:hypothetical protein
VFKLGLSKMKPGRSHRASRHRAAPARPCARALGVRTRAQPDAPPPKVMHRPRPRASPGRSRARGSSTTPRRGAVRAPCTRRTAGPSAAPTVRAPAKGVVVRRNPRRHHVVTSGRALYLRSSFFLPLRAITTAPDHPTVPPWPPPASRRLASPPGHARVSNFLRVSSTSTSHALPPVRPPLVGVRAAAATAVGQHQAPASVTSPPQPRPPQGPR